MIEARAGLPIHAFADRAAFEAWLAAQPESAPGLWLKLGKKGRAQTLSRAEAIDAGLCHGWIDGQGDPYDDDYWLVRFTPRRARSRWSQVNVKRAEQLLAAGEVGARGQREIAAAKADGRWGAAYAPPSTAAVPAELQVALDASPAAAAFFAGLSGANRYAILHRIGAVKTAAARARNVAKFVGMLERGEVIYPQR